MYYSEYLKCKWARCMDNTPHLWVDGLSCPWPCCSRNLLVQRLEPNP
jgi:hypothetical protein